MRFINSEFVRFIFVGGVNAAATFGIYALLLLIWPYPVAYSAAYLTGIFISYYLNTRFVFRKSIDLKKALRYPLVYLAQYLTGLLALYILVDTLHINKLLASPLTTVVTIPVTFIISRYIIKGHVPATNNLSIDVRKDRVI